MTDGADLVDDVEDLRSVVGSEVVLGEHVARPGIFERDGGPRCEYLCVDCGLVGIHVALFAGVSCDREEGPLAMDGDAR
jgi:hypothetical protein